MKDLFLFVVAMVAVLAAPLSAQTQDDQRSLGDDLKSIGRAVLVHEGGKLLERVAKDGQDAKKQKAGKKAKNKQWVDDAEGADDTEDAAAPRRTWADRRRDVVDVFLNGEKSLLENIKAGIDVILDEYREEFKAEGRAYAKELGDTLADRVCAHPKIASTLFSVKCLCWGVVVYLSLVTLYLVFTVHRLRAENNRLIRLVEERLKLTEEAEKEAAGKGA